MDCCICSAVPMILRPPRNTICGACHEAARSLIAFVNKQLESSCTDQMKGYSSSSPSMLAVNDLPNKSSNASSLVSLHPNSSKGFASVVKWAKEMKEAEGELKEKIDFLDGFAAAFMDQSHTDIQIKPGGDGPSIPAHKALLAARSEIFKNMLEADGCKAPPNDTVTLPELSHEQLQSLLEFLYSGSLAAEKAEKHLYSLSIAADKYEIPFLQRFCERRMLGSLNPSNALDVLEISDVCSNLQALKETALNYVVGNMEDIVFSARYDAFALKNPHLSVQIMRAALIDIKNRKNGVV
ncbi:BTB/POZ domain-containing protein At3g56230-like [Malania oleifera]|uniref:BTB/POZ domain-containing protein At3g56230-like n=1 Tax=Malania oleifera TaxID=397392 RepID=UPI0025AD9EEB|nr:BTB/POZ domain-containing protein At3g56230-like [Malania oleifera]